jgi:hypothetical protein
LFAYKRKSTIPELKKFYWPQITQITQIKKREGWLVLELSAFLFPIPSQQKQNPDDQLSPIQIKKFA